MINSINSTYNNSNSKVAFGSVLKMYPSSFDAKYFQDIVELSKKMGNDGINGEMVLKKVISPESNPIAAFVSSVPRFVVEVFAKIDDAIGNLASKSYRQANNIPVDTNHIPVEMRVRSEQFFNDTAGIFSRATDIAKDAERRIKTPAFQVKPDKLADYREAIIVATNSTYDNASIKYAEKLAENTEKRLKAGKSFREAFDFAGGDAFQDMLNNEHYEMSYRQITTARELLKSVWSLGDKVA